MADAARSRKASDPLPGNDLREMDGTNAPELPM